MQDEDKEGEPDNKRYRADPNQHQINVPEHNLAELYRRMAQFYSHGDQMQLIGNGMYLPEIQRFVKFATCEEKTWIKNSIQPYESKPITAKNPDLTNQIQAWFAAIWKANMLNDIKPGDGVVLLLIEAINNPLASDAEYTWAGVLIDCVAGVHRNHQVLRRCSGFAPYIFELAVKHKVSFAFGSYNCEAMPSFVHPLGHVAQHAPVYTRLRCASNDMALGAVVKAMAYHLSHHYSKCDFKRSETQDLIGMSFFGLGNLLPILRANQFIASAENLVPLPIAIDVSNKKQDITFFNKQPIPPVTQKPDDATKMDPIFLLEVKRLADVSTNLSEKRQRIRLKNWNDIINFAKIKDWKILLAHAMKAVIYGSDDKKTDYSLELLYTDLMEIYAKEPLGILEKLLPQLYWVILNCDQVEKVNFKLSHLSVAKVVNNFKSMSLLCFAEDIWLLLRSIDNRKEIRNYLEVFLLENPVLNPNYLKDHESRLYTRSV